MRPIVMNTRTCYCVASIQIGSAHVDGASISRHYHGVIKIVVANICIVVCNDGPILN